MELLGDVGQVEAHFDPFVDSVNLSQDRCTVCAECTMGMEIFLATPNGPSRWCGSNVARFCSFGNSVNLDARLQTALISVQDRCMVWDKHTIGLKIVLGAPDGTP
jgi:hypothetical protein